MQNGGGGEGEEDAPGELGFRSVGAAWRRVYEPNRGKHGPEERGDVSREPRDGQEALDLSVQVKPSSSVRVAIDYEDRTFVVLRRHDPREPHRLPNDEAFHGYVVSWEDLPQPMRNALIRAGMADRRGRIL